MIRAKVITLNLLEPKQRSMDNINEMVLPLFGGADKSSFEMTENELKEAAKSIKRKAREKAFSKGLPVYSSKAGDLFIEYPDGKIVIVECK